MGHEGSARPGGDQALLKTAQSGGGFQRYAWNKPSTGEITDKLSYVVTLDRWGWILGTGIYQEDVERFTQQARDEVARGIHQTMLEIALVALVAVWLVFAGGMTLNFSEQRLADRKLRHLTRRIISLQEEERTRIARELHDGISQLLVSIKFKFELATHVLEKQQYDKGLNLLKDATERMGEAIGEVRSLSHDLRSSLLDSLGLPAAIGHLAAEFEQRTGLQVSCSVDAFEGRLSDAVAVSLFRIVQEGLANIERHARARNVSIMLRSDDTSIRLTMVDDGTGFDIAEVTRRQAGIGLRNIRERVEQFGGRLELTSVPGRSELDVLLPARQPGDKVAPCYRQSCAARSKGDALKVDASS